jgi:hypothetical protein
LIPVAHGRRRSELLVVVAGLILRLNVWAIRGGAGSVTGNDESALDDVNVAEVDAP